MRLAHLSFDELERVLYMQKDRSPVVTAAHEAVADLLDCEPEPVNPLFTGECPACGYPSEDV